MQMSVVTKNPGSHQRVSLDLDGSTEGLLTNPDENPLGVTGVWSINVFSKRNSAFSVEEYWFDFGGGSGGQADRIFIQGFASIAGAPRLVVRNSASAIIKDFRFANSNPPVGEWVMITMTMDESIGALGRTLGYFNGVEDTAPTKTVDASPGVGRSDSNKRLGLLNANLPGFEGASNALYVSVHSVELTAAEILEIYNRGEGGDFDLSRNIRNYVSSASLVHWWRLGHDPNDFGKDSGLAATLINIGTNSLNIDQSDIVNVVPPKV